MAMWDTLTKAAVILGLVTLAKKFGVRGHWSQLLAVILGIFIEILELYATYATYDALTLQLLISTSWQGLIAGLTAAGLWDVAGRATSSAPTRRGRHHEPEE